MRVIKPNDKVIKPRQIPRPIQKIVKFIFPDERQEFDASMYPERPHIGEKLRIPKNELLKGGVYECTEVTIEMIKDAYIINCRFKATL